MYQGPIQHRHGAEPALLAHELGHVGREEAELVKEISVGNHHDRVPVARKRLCDRKPRIHVAEAQPQQREQPLSGLRVCLLYTSRCV